MGRIVFVALMLLAAACSPQPQATPEAPPVASADVTSDALAAALTPVVAQEIGQPVTLTPTITRVQNEWAWVSMQTRRPNGSPIDWTTTSLASRYENGVMDESGGVYALLRQENGAWRVVTYVIAPTDVAWENWPAEYGAPAELVRP